MADCEILETCIFFTDRMQSMPATSEWMKIHYCRDRFEECARHIVCQALGRSRVPPDLLPTQTDRVQVLLAGAVPSAAPAGSDPIPLISRKPDPPR